MNYEHVPCIICKSFDTTLRFSKPWGDDEVFTLVRCKHCGLEFVNPRPFYNDMPQYYKGYFDKRTDRGYSDYFSKAMQTEVLRLLALNLADLNFYEFESTLPDTRYALDIGCAAGYFVDYMAKRGWKSSGIDIAPDCINYATTQLHVDAYCDDFLTFNFTNTYHLITLWATIEHLHYPDRFLEKIFSLLHDDGLLYISTCRSSIWSPRILFGKRWRYYNFPHHLYFFSYATLAKLLQLKGFTITRFATYGSGICKAGSTIRTVADGLAKKLYLGDMMLIAAKKQKHTFNC